MSTITGFLLTRQWRDTPQGVELVFWAHSERGPLRIVVAQQQALCFIARETPLHPQWMARTSSSRKALALITLDGMAVDGLYFQQQRDLKALQSIAQEQHFRLYESDIKPADRYLMERFINASFEVRGDIRQCEGYLEITQATLRHGECKPLLNYVSLDIETSDLDGELYSIAVCTRDEALVFMIGEAIPDQRLRILFFADERTLLQAFFAWLRISDPDLIIGWNVIDFDLNFLERKCRFLGVPYDFARGGESATLLQAQTKEQSRLVRFPGRVVLDGIDTLRSATWSFESFALEAVAQQLLGRGKLITAEQDKLAEIQHLFAADKPKLAAYNLEDCRLVVDIFQATDLFNFAIQRARMTGLAMDRMGGSVAAFDNLYLPRLHRYGRVAPDVGSSENRVNSPGGFVLDSKPGLYENVLVLDFKSLYPSIIRTFKIDPLGLSAPGENPIPGFLQGNFSRTEHILPELISTLWTQRDAAKQQGNAALSQAIKIIMNSFYGVLGSFGCRFFDPRLASSITLRGHEIIHRTRERIEARGYEVIYGDTDSLFVLLGSGHDEIAAQVIGKDLASDLNRWWQQHLQSQFKLRSHLEIEFETHYTHFLMPTVRGAETGSKKRYAGVVHKGEQHKLVFKGLETVRSDWTPLAREFQHELYRRVFFSEPYMDFIRDTVADLTAGKLDAKLVYRKRLRRALKDYVKNVPPHVQAARKQAKPGRQVRYLITTCGPEPVDNLTAPADYQHYIDRQLAPAANSILHFLGTTLEEITEKQILMF